MPQKSLLKANKKIEKKSAANKHGKAGSTTKRGKLAKPPKKTKFAAAYKDTKELTKAINARNEQQAAGLAMQSGGHLTLVKAPILATAGTKNASKKKGGPVKKK